MKKYQKETIIIEKKDKVLTDPDLIAFHLMVKNLRSEYGIILFIKLTKKAAIPFAYCSAFVAIFHLLEKYLRILNMLFCIYNIYIVLWLCIFQVIKNLFPR